MIEAEAEGNHAENRHEENYDHHDHGEPRHHEQFEPFHIEAHDQPAGDDDDEQRDSPKQAGVAEPQGNQDRHECTDGRDADHVPQDDQQKDTDRHDEKDAI